GRRRGVLGRADQVCQDVRLARLDGSRGGGRGVAFRRLHPGGVSVLIAGGRRLRGRGVGGGILPRWGDHGEDGHGRLGGQEDACFERLERELAPVGARAAAPGVTRHGFDLLPFVRPQYLIRGRRTPSRRVFVGAAKGVPAENLFRGAAVLGRGREND